jgi:hypothetical protein
MCACRAAREAHRCRSACASIRVVRAVHGALQRRKQSKRARLRRDCEPGAGCRRRHDEPSAAGSSSRDAACLLSSNNGANPTISARFTPAATPTCTATTPGVWTLTDLDRNNVRRIALDDANSCISPQLAPSRQCSRRVSWRMSTWTRRESNISTFRRIALAAMRNCVATFAVKIFPARVPMQLMSALGDTWVVRWQRFRATGVIRASGCARP